MPAPGSFEAPAPEALLRATFPPMLATLVERPPREAGRYQHELKYDGFRALSAIAGGHVAMWSRNALDLAPRFPGIATALARLPVETCVLDGELAVLDPRGVPRFQLLQQSGGPPVMFVFDLLHLDGEDLRSSPLAERRARLEALLDRAPPGPLRLAELLPGPADRAVALAARRGYEGIIGKHRDAPYAAGRSRAWFKLKLQARQELAIAGFTAHSALPGHIGALLLAVADEGGSLAYAGKVGTGFTADQRASLFHLLQPDAAARPTASGAPRLARVTWVRPRHVAEIRFAEWTHDGRLRGPVFLGLRPDKRPEDCVRERPAPADEEPRADEHRAAPAVVLTHPDKVLYPRDGYTKRDLLAYYEATTAPLLVALADRPLNLQRWPEGIDGPDFFRQDIDRREPWMRLAPIRTRTGGRCVHHLVADRPIALRWLAQSAVLALHMWSAREHEIDHPDWVIFDLDPGDGGDFAEVLAPARALRALLDRLGVPSFPKTSGKRGLHVLVPLLPIHTHAEALAFAAAVTRAIARVVPGATTARALARRGGRLYLDAYQNGFGKTLVAPYSPRAVDGAPVSCPLDWSEVRRGLDPARFTIRTMPARLDRVGDRFAPIFRHRARLPRLA